MLGDSRPIADAHREVERVDQELQQQFTLCLTHPLDQVIDALDVAASVGPQSAERWDLPPSDREALRRWGVPVDETGTGPAAVQLAGAVQAGDVPEISTRGIVAYSLGTYWRRRLGAVIGSGEVIGVTTDTEERVSRINSSVSAFVETTWRWACARRTLSMIEDHGDYKQLYDDLAAFQNYVHMLDPAVRDDPEFEWWNGITNGW
jgi:hypothetical protein